jgi:hypothetical protein
MRIYHILILLLAALTTDSLAQHVTPDDLLTTERVQIGRNIAAVIGTSPTQSPSGKYYFMSLTPDTYTSGPRNSVVSIYNHKRGFLQVVIRDHGHTPFEIKWISDKLLYIRTWWADKAPIDIIVDIISESIIYIDHAGLEGLDDTTANTQEGTEQSHPAYALTRVGRMPRRWPSPGPWLSIQGSRGCCIRGWRPVPVTRSRRGR